MSAALLDVDDFLARAAGRLHPEPVPAPDDVARQGGDHDLNELPPPLPVKPAAVLIPVVTRPGEAMVLFTQRAADLRNHSGQISFPGGRTDPGDRSALDTALREAEEEIGLDRCLVRPIGYLDPYRSSSNYLVTPVVGLLQPGFSLALNAAEVSEVFEVPLRFLMDAVNHQIHSRPWQGGERRYYAIPFGERYIWGLTAALIRNLHDRLYGT